MINDYKRWKDQQDLPPGLKRELDLMDGHEDQIREAFGSELEFGTSGMRGMMGPGTNRMNVYVVRKVSQAISNYILERKMNPAVVIGYDSRIYSDVFAAEAAAVFQANGITAHLFSVIVPVSAVSFGVRNLNCSMGIMITASHNSREYNGYKVYDDRGCQIAGDLPLAILRECRKIDLFRDVNYECLQPQYIEKSLLEEYLQAISEEALYWDTKEAVIHQMGKLNLVYTPLNGAGNLFVRETLKRIGVTEILVPSDQEKPDGNFPTCPYPNPEKPEVYEQSMKLLDKSCGDLIIATDPDCDRVGVAVQDCGQIKVMSGNEIGLILFDFICKLRLENGRMPENAVAARSVVSSPMMDRIAAHYKVNVRCTLNGFKHIARFMEALAQQNRIQDFIFGFEQSNGYLTSTRLRDKDGVSASMLICQAAAYYKQKNMTLVDVLKGIYDSYGYYLDDALEFCFEGLEGARRIEGLMDGFRACRGSLFSSGEKVIDYMSQTDYRLPKDNMIQVTYKDGMSFMVRPSGTEPKIKFYIFASGSSCLEAQRRKEHLKKALSDYIEGVQRVD